MNTGNQITPLGKRTGFWNFYYPRSGNLKNVVNYSNGIRNGMHKTFYERKPLPRSIRHFLDGVLEGEKIYCYYERYLQ